MLGCPQIQRACLAERPPRCEIVQDHAALFGVGERWASEEVGLGVASTHELGGHVQQNRGFELASVHVFEMVGLPRRRPFGLGSSRPDGERESCAASPTFASWTTLPKA